MMVALHWSGVVVMWYWWRQWCGGGGRVVLCGVGVVVVCGG